MKVNSEAIRSMFAGRRWRAEKCKPLVALMWLIGGAAMAVMMLPWLRLFM